VTSWCFGSVSQWKEGERKVTESGERGQSGCCWEKQMSSTTCMLQMAIAK